METASFPLSPLWELDRKTQLLQKEHHMKAGKLMLGCVAALAVVIVGSQSVPADDKPEPKKTDDKVWTVVVHRVEVEKTKANGEAWDINNGKPDLVVIVRNISDKDQKEFQTKEATDTFTAEYDAPTTIKARADQTLEFEVVDKDVALNDQIGKVQRKVGTELKEGKSKLEKFGRVIMLEI